MSLTQIRRLSSCCGTTERLMLAPEQIEEELLDEERAGGTAGRRRQELYDANEPGFATARAGATERKKKSRRLL